MAASRQAAFRASRAATVKRLVGVATHEAILEADEACEEALAAMEMRATTAEREVGELRKSLDQSSDNIRYWRGESKKNARMRSDPPALRREDREIRDLRAEIHRLRVGARLPFPELVSEDGAKSHHHRRADVVRD